MIPWLIAAFVLVLALWLAYKIGMIVLRIAAGLAFLAFISALIWYIFLR
ncbi:MAG: hypothetical protein IPP78_15145 [Holophagaceae bacterium]|nr:hypothetical protein [Holophagaceae bacterium]